MQTRSTILKRIESLEKLADTIKDEASGLRKELLHVDAGTHPKRGRKTVSAAAVSHMLNNRAAARTRKTA